MSKIHCLKTWPEFYNAVVDGTKTFEVRKYDRDFRVGDALVLQEFDPGTRKYTGEMITKKITYMLTDPAWVKDGYVVLGLKDWPDTWSDE